MKILGLANPEFKGVSEATRAICTDYYPIVHMDNEAHVDHATKTILNFKPDLLIVGGWSRGYDQLVKKLLNRNFPVICVYHSTIYHGKHFGDDVYLPQIERAMFSKHIDHMCFVDPGTATYYQKVRKIPALFVPHQFDLKSRVHPPSVNQQFNIGVLGGIDVFYKNSWGAATVARDFAANHPGVHVIMPRGYEKPRHLFHEDVLSKCHVLIHTSHLECYSNMIQEAWSFGIPVICSPSADGLIRGPMLTDRDKEIVGKLRLESNTDALGTYQKLSDVHKNWDKYAQEVHTVYDDVSDRTKTYTARLMSRIVKNYKTRAGNFDDILAF